MSVLRLRARRRSLVPGVTVLIANWRTTAFAQAAVQRVVRMSPNGTRIIIVDNQSTKQSRAALAAPRSATFVVPVPVNLGHGLALDLAAVLASTEYIVALDADAFPIDRTWLVRLSDPLERGEAAVSGAGGSRGHVAPCCLMISLKRFLDRGHTFTPRFVPGNDPWLKPDQVWDVGRRISIVEGPAALHRLQCVRYLDPARQVGEIFGGVVYHNGYATIDVAPSDRGSVTKADALATWELALDRFTD